MPQLLRVRSLWNVPSGGAGVSTMFFEGALEPPASYNTLVAAVRTFWDGCKAGLAPGVTITMDGEIAFIDEATGLLEQWRAVTPGTPVAGASSGAYAAPAGVVVSWLTDAVIEGRRLRGRTFLVPLGGASLQTDGTIADASVTTFLNAGNALRTAAAANSTPMRVYSRPQDGPPARAGQSALVTGVRVADRASVLRSRRD